jgi:sec-independent protein translocase protein TatA
MNSLQMPLAFFGMPGQYEMLIIAGVALLLFGNRLPSVMKSLGASFVAFKQGLAEGASDAVADRAVLDGKS